MSYNSGITPVLGGGIASVILNIVKHTKNIIDYTIVTSYNKQDIEDARELYGSEVKIVSTNTINNLGLDFLSYSFKVPMRDFDVVHFHDLPFGRTMPLVFKSCIRQLNPILSFHSSALRTGYFPIRNAFGRGYHNFVLENSCRFWKKIIVNSEYSLQDIKAYVADPSVIEIIPNGVDISAVRESESLDLDGDPAFLMVGHLEWVKGIDILLEAFARLVERKNLPGAHLHVVGDGSLTSYCEEFVARTNLTQRVHFWGSQPQSIVYRFIKGCDAFVLSSRYEGFAVVLLEAMAAEKPIVSTTVGGIPYFIKDGRNGLLVSPKTDELLSAMENLSSDPNLVKCITENNRIDAERFSWEKISQSYLHLYESLVNC
jgi:glycosyltransferase involved in cell wall biosynthesis